MSKKHTYRTTATWTGNLGEGTSSYTAYLRNFTVSAEGKPDLGPYDAILIGGGIEELPQPIADQLAEGGRIVAMFIEGALGVVRLGRKLDGRIDWRLAFHAGGPVLPGYERRAGFVL